MAYKYDAASQRARITRPDQVWFEYVRDTLGRPFYLAACDNGACHNSGQRAGSEAPA